MAFIVTRNEKMSFADDSNGNAAETNVINCSVDQVVINYFLQVVINLQMFLRQVSRVSAQLSTWPSVLLTVLLGRRSLKLFRTNQLSPFYEKY